ncbi:MAG: hypothetical protein KGO52_06000 [Nitrospirota bacterium]|nr:hypothetical protein [Nitrospirota bacterium]MDE3035515.1 hypothetical protein [Nitrospirota bacterium]MDE3225832.1 hypothetical protein [Nitrospirota bacterium]MDE3242253.1 hypothetical protein [Nitrospirota bacterium]
MSGPRRVVVSFVSLLMLGACVASLPLAPTSDTDPVTAAYNEAITQSAAARRYAEPAPSGRNFDRRIGAGMTEGPSVPYPMNAGR